ncbi:APC family permease [Anaerotignum sp.]|uniref:APC family permease n=1 Tax=Anaerotignum sp. TaxID=2039241 RepID=UPI0028AD8F96|nr:APC family permease [Anaerotignum sp.]
MKNESGRFTKALGAMEILSLAFGATIGWGWVVLSGDWIKTGGTLGAILGFILCGFMLIFVGMTYSELCPALPKCGGEHVFSLRALGYNWSFICSWSLALCYLGVVCFEACALPNVVEVLLPAADIGYMYSIAGYPIHVTYVLIGFFSAAAILIINYIGIRCAAKLQKLLILALALVGISIMVSACFTGSIANTKPLFSDGISGTLSIAVMAPFFMVGFDVVPQAAEESNIEPRKLGKYMLMSIVLAVAWYCLIILSVSMILTDQEMVTKNLSTAYAMEKSWGRFGDVAKYFVVFGGVAGIMSSWNAFLLAGSRLLFAMAENKMIPSWFAKIHPKYQTPSNAILFLGGISCIAPLFGKAMMTWISNAASFTTVIAYGLTACSFLVLRKKEPELERPYKVSHYRFVGTIAILLSIGMLLLYIPGMPSGLGKEEWIILVIWGMLGALMLILCKQKYRKDKIHLQKKTMNVN